MNFIDIKLKSKNGYNIKQFTISEFISFEIKGEYMRNFILSTERTADLPNEYIEKYDLKTTNMLYYLGDEEYGGQTGRELENKKLLDGMREGIMTRTSQINQEQAREYFFELLKEGKDILHLGFAGALSGTLENFKAVAEELNQTSKNKIYVLDTKCASSGQGLLVVLTAEYIEKNNADIKSAFEYADSLKDRLCHYFVVDNLKYLARGGRCTKSTAFIGNVLHIKPLLHSNEEGKLVPLQKVISRKRSLKGLVERMEKMFNKESDIVFVGHADCYEDAKYVADEVKEKFNITPAIMEIGPVIASHSGPGTVALFFTSDTRVDK